MRLFAICLAAVLSGVASSPTLSRSPLRLEYTLRVDTTDLTGIAVEMRIRNAPAAITLAAQAHPEYDDKYWRYLDHFAATDAGNASIAATRVDSVRWRLTNKAGDVIVRYHVAFPREEPLRASWRPFVARTGGLVGGPHSFLYVIGGEDASATVTLDIPKTWRVASGLGTSSASASSPSAMHQLSAPNMHALMESPMLVGDLRIWDFRVNDIPHHVVYWPLPNAVPFDTIAFVRDARMLATQAVTMFGGAPYREYTFLFQDGAYRGGLEHPNSVTLGAPSAELATDPHAALAEVAHEFFHTWNLMSFKPVEYRTIDYRVQAPVSSLWFSEGLTIYYADLIRRRGGLRVDDSTRTEHLARLIERYLSSPGNARFSAEQVSNVEYNASPAALGDYSASSHLVGELLGTLLDFQVRSATNGTRSMDDVMRLLNKRFVQNGFTGADLQRAIDETCGCSSADIFDKYVRNAGVVDFGRYLALAGLRARVTWEPSLNGAGQPVPDLRIYGWQDANDHQLRFRLTDPASVWGKAGLHTGDRVVSINNAAIRTWPELRTYLRAVKVGDSAIVVVERDGKRVETRLQVTGFDRPVVRIEALEQAPVRQVALREVWMRGN